jgi:hypothetical protein
MVSSLKPSCRCRCVTSRLCSSGSESGHCSNRATRRLKPRRPFGRFGQRPLAPAALATRSTVKSSLTLTGFSTTRWDQVERLYPYIARRLTPDWMRSFVVAEVDRVAAVADSDDYLTAHSRGWEGRPEPDVGRPASALGSTSGLPVGRGQPDRTCVRQVLQHSLDRPPPRLGTRRFGRGRPVARPRNHLPAVLAWGCSAA